MTTKVSLGVVAANAVDTAQLASAAVETASIAGNAVVSAKIAANQIITAKIASNAITSGHITSGEVTTDHLADNAITTDKIAANAITLAKITSGTLTADSLADNSITGAKIAQNSIDSSEIVSGSIDTVHIADSQVTNAKLANSSVTVNSNSVALGASITLDTDDIGEGATNQYFTNARAQGAITVTDAGGDGSLGYSGGTITYTGPSAAETRAHFSAGTGIGISSGQISIGQAVATTDSPTFNDLTLDGDLNLTGDLNITGDLNTLTVTDLDVVDKTITLGAGQVASASGGSGIVVERTDSTNPSILWNETNTQFDINNALNVSSASTDVAKFVSTGSYTFIALDNATRDWALSAGSSFGIYDKDAAATRLTIDSSGNLLVGTTDTTLYNNTSGSGFHVSPIGFTEVAYESANAADPAFLVNNTGADGDIIQLRKDGSVVGSIGTLSGDLTIGTGDTGLGFLDGGNFIQPHNIATNAVRDAAIDLGTTSGRFKDLYLSNGVDLNRADGGTQVQVAMKQAGTLKSQLTSNFGDSKFYLYHQGGNRLVIDSSGNVGIGTSSALNNAILNVAGGVNTTTGIIGTLVSDSFTFNGQTNPQYGINFNPTNNRPIGISGYYGIAFATQGTERIRILESGNVGIGTDNPDYNLHVEKSSASANVDLLVKNSGTDGTSNTRIMSYVSGASGGDPKIGLGVTGVRDYFWRIDNSDSDKLILDTNGTDIFTIDTSGNVGIGTSSPSKLLTIGSSTTANTTARLNCSTTAGSDTGMYSFGIDNTSDFAGIKLDYSQRVTHGLQIFTTAGYSYPITLSTTGGQDVVLDSSGNVGIGTNSPAYTLDLLSSTSGYVSRFKSSGNYGGILVDAGSAGSPGGGYVGVAKNGTRYGIYGTSGAWIGDTSTDVALASESGSNLRFFTNGSVTEKMRIDSSGNVGIGQAPSGNNLLEVRGDISTEWGVSPTNIGMKYVDGSQYYLGLTLVDSGRQTRVVSKSADNTGYIAFDTGASATERMRIDSSGNVLPGADNTYNLGASATRWANIYTADLQLSNEGQEGGNDIDGTTGSWTIQEGEDNLFLINKKNGKKYKFKLEEV